MSFLTSKGRLTETSFSWTRFQSLCTLLKCLLPRCWIQFLLHEFRMEQSGKTLCGVSTHFTPYTGLSNTKTTFQWEFKAVLEAIRSEPNKSTGIHFSYKPPVIGLNINFSLLGLKKENEDQISNGEERRRREMEKK